MSRHVHIDKKDVLELRSQGLSISAIAERYSCSRSKIYYILSGGKRKPKRTMVCPYCKKTVKVASNRRKTCGSKECSKAHNRALSRAHNEKKKQKAAPGSRIRPYTETSNMLIVQDLARGRSIKHIAKMYDRDPDDLQRHIEKILRDGTADRINRMLAVYRRNNVLM